ncbi:hypothetical protein AGLY_010052 [Aphis glycines]|uniref:Uncharacterized protein n=1 Tax=Aphis glycines TaxID=307491 RepID=A0A6G0TGX4_APHGL|nr:hypothetical protein AGLY_010052 [Aphis glycines]
MIYIFAQHTLQLYGTLNFKCNSVKKHSTFICDLLTTCHNYNFRCFLDLNGFHEIGVSSVTDIILRPPINLTPPKCILGVFMSGNISSFLKKIKLQKSMKTNFSPSVPSSLRGTEAKKLRRSLFFSNGTAICIKRLTFSLPETAAVCRQKSHKYVCSRKIQFSNVKDKSIQQLIRVVYASHPQSNDEQQSRDS